MKGISPGGPGWCFATPKAIAQKNTTPNTITPGHHGRVIHADEHHQCHNAEEEGRQDEDDGPYKQEGPSSFFRRECDDVFVMDKVGVVTW